MSSENKVIKDDNHLILILIYDIFAEKLMDVETELSNEIGFIKVVYGGLEAGERNIIYKHGFLHRCLSLKVIMPTAREIITRVRQDRYFVEIMDIFKIVDDHEMRMRKEILGGLIKRKKVLNDMYREMMLIEFDIGG